MSHVMFVTYTHLRNSIQGLARLRGRPGSRDLNSGQTPGRVCGRCGTKVPADGFPEMMVPTTDSGWATEEMAVTLCDGSWPVSHPKKKAS